jgi:amino acid adenylation domain-containing protein
METLTEINDAEADLQAAEVEGFRLSPQQRRLWSLQQADGTQPFRVRAMVLLEGRLDVVALREAVRRVVLRHEILRTTFRRLPGMAFPVQVIQDEPIYSLDEQTLVHTGEQEQARAADSLWEETRSAPFDFEHGPMVRFSLVALSGSRHLLFVVLPALCSDESGVAVLVRDICASYAVLSGGEEAAAEVLQYADISEVLNELVESEEGAGGRDRRLERSVIEAADAKVPFEEGASGAQGFAPQVFGRAIDSGLAAKLEELARARQLDLATVLQASWHVLAWRLTGQAETASGRMFSGRVYEGLDQVPGLFARHLPVSSLQDEAQRFDDVLAQIGQAAAQAEEGQDYFNWEYASQLQQREQSQPLFLPLGFEFAEQPAPMRLADLSWTLRRQESCTERFTLKLRVVSTAAEGLRTEFHYDAARLTLASVERLARHFHTLLASVAERELARLGELNILDDQQRHQLLFEFNRTTVNYGPPSCLHEYIEAQAARTPDSTAVVFGSEQLTYAELDGRANQLSRHLRRLGAGSEMSIGVLFERGLEMIVGLLGVLKAGAAYIPLDPEYPQERLKSMVRDGRPVLLLTEERLRSKLNALGDESPAVVCIDTEWETIAAQSTARVESDVRPENLAYIIYTSGSTGRPKGVQITHRAISNRLLWMQHRFPLRPQDVLLQKTVYGFDASVWELFLPLMVGARVVMAKPGGHRDSAYLVEEIERSGVTVLQMVPSMLEVLLEERGIEGCKSLRRVYCGGEALSGRLQERFYERVSWGELVNLYGPTEASIDASYYSCTPGERRAGQTVPIGKPISNIEIYLLDGAMEPVPVGVGGELYIGGEGLARGYLSRPSLTAERFVPDPFSGRAGGRLYRTGDVARYLEEGVIEYLGRADQQVKVRGFRIELGEIEAALNRHPAVRQCVVVAREDASGEKRLVAYVVGAGSESPVVGELRGYLKESLPEYMVPSAFVLMEALPLAANGKLDRKVLLPPEQAQTGPERAFNAPRTLIEETLSNIWAEVLKLDRVGINDNFFELGGDSIRSIQVKALAQKVGLEFSLEQLFEHQTVYELARAIQAAEPGSAPSPKTEPFGLIAEEDRLKMPPEVEDAYPLAMLQAGMLFHREYSPGTAIYHDITSYHLRGQLDMDALRRAVVQLAARHPILRTSFDLTSYSEPLQLVHESATIPLEEFDLRGLSDVEQRKALANWTEEQKMRPFDASRPPLMRFTVHRRGEESLQFTMNCHHAILDGWSVAAMVSELFELYFSALGKELHTVAPPPTVAFRDFVALEREALTSPAHGEYWMRKLADSTVLKLPRWRESAREEAEGHAHPFLHEVRLTNEVSNGLWRLARLAGVPVKSVLLSAHMRVMRLLGGQTDVLTGVVTNCRLEASDGERALGLFLNTVPLRQRLSGGRWLDLVRETFATEREMLPHRWFPLAEMQRRLGGQHLFEAVFNFIHFHVYESVSGFAEMESLGAESFEQTNHTLTASFSLEGPTQRVHLGLLCDATQLSEEQAEAIAGYYAKTLEAMASAPEQRYETVSLLSDAERQRMLFEWNQTGGGYDLDNCLHRHVEAQAALTPDAPAVTFEGDTLSYAQLNARANQLARRLQSLGVGPDVTVGVVMERSLEMLTGLLAILKAGGAYLPLDPDNPRERLSLVLKDAAPSLLLTQPHLRGILPDHSAEIVCLDGDWKAFEAEPAENLQSDVRPENLAYIIYTSGSTGRPKGVQITHRAISNRLLWMQHRFPLRSQDVLLQKTVYGFDASVWELFLPLMVGARVVMARPGGHRDSAYLVEEIERSGVTVLQMVPSMLEVLLEERGIEGCKSLRRVYCGGEALSGRLQERFYERMSWGELVNLYGPTEASIDASYWPCERGSRSNKVLIGRPIKNVQLYLLDAAMEPVPVGVGGELYIGGEGLARGYLSRPSLTAERFAPDPFSGRAGGRLYRTGDVARYLEEGVIEYLGRADQQVKVRGFRIELGEIEAALCELSGVREAVVLAREDASGGKRLVAYVVPSKEEADGPTAEELQRGLRERLPDYMVPQAFVMLEQLPLLANGKLDSRALPEPEMDWRSDDDTYVGPRTPIEEVMAGIWANALRVERVGIYDNFFTLGGHSLLATQVISRVRQVFNIELPLRTLFDEPTVYDLSRQVEAARRADLGLQAQPIRPVSREAALPLSFSQQRLWFLDQLEPGGAAYNVASAIRLKGELDVAALRRSLDAVVLRHEVLRTTFTTQGGRPVQVVGPAETIEVPVIDLRELPEAEKASRLRAHTSEESQRPFDLARGPLMRVLLLRLSDDEHAMLLTMHHIVSDGWSLGVLVRELSSLYEAFSRGESPQLPALPVQYADFSAWQRDWLSGGVLEAQLAYWRRQLANAPAVVELPTDRPRPSVQTYRGANLHTVVSKSTTEALKTLSRREGASLFMTALAAFKVLVGRQSRREQVVVGTDVANRNRDEVEGLIGFFANQLVLHTDLSGDPDFRELLGRVREVTLGAYAHQDLPFDKLVETLRPERDPSRTPLFQLKVVMQNAPMPTLELPGLSLASEELGGGTAKFDLTLFLEETAQGLNCTWQYNSDLFEAQTVRRLAEHFALLLDKIAIQSGVKVGELNDALDAAEREERLGDKRRLEAANLERFKRFSPRAIRAE